MRTSIAIKPKGTPEASFTPAPFGAMQRKCACGSSSRTGECPECSNKERALQRQPAGQRGRGTVPPIVYDVLRSPGQPLHPHTRAFMESRFGYDFSQVRIHTDTRAGESAQAVGALAYTVGRHVVLADPQFELPSALGKQLVAHELTHVVQQRSVGQSNPVGITPENHPSERVAETIAMDMVTTSEANHLGATHSLASPTLQRALPAALVTAGEVTEVALTAAIVLQEQHTISQGKLLIVSQTASRRGDPPQPKDNDYEARIFFAGSTSALSPEVHADLRVHWQGNSFGEIGAAYVDVEVEHPKFSYSALEARFTPLDNLPSKGEDPRAWPMQWVYDGSFDPAGPGDYEFQGKFEINAFGGFRIIDHKVVDHSLLSARAPADEFVKKGRDLHAAIPPLPPGKKVTVKGPRGKAEK